MGASIECREPFLDQRLIAGLGSLDNNWFFRGKKGKYILKTAMQDRLPSEVLSFRKVGLSVPWGDYIIKSPAFKEELASLRNSELFKLPYFEKIKINSLVDNLQKGDARMVPYIMPLFMMHIWLDNYVYKFDPTQKKAEATR
jgi:asparagine synthase (glutamine-hydrolysing)